MAESQNVISAISNSMNFSTILDHFWHFEKSLKKASLELKKRF